MIVTVIIAILLCYGVWVAIVLGHDRRKRGRMIVGESRKTIVPPEEVMGKSLFVLSQSLPQAASKSKTENPEQKADTFAPEPEKRTSARIPEHMLDEVFSSTPEEFSEEDWVDDDEADSQINLDEEEELYGEPLPDAQYATGVFYEDMNNAVQVAAMESPAEEQKRKAGETFSEMEGNDLYEKLMRGAPLLSSRIKKLLDASLKSYQPQPAVTFGKMPEDFAEFDIRNFM